MWPFSRKKKIYPIALSPRVRDIVEALFFPAERAEVIRLLESECGLSLPLFFSNEPSSYDQVRLAVLKMSNGNVDKLKEQIKEAHVDWRDVIMAAEFGFNPENHKTWDPRR